jgi:hypothetical protein
MARIDACTYPAGIAADATPVDPMANPNAVSVVCNNHVAGLENDRPMGKTVTAKSVEPAVRAKLRRVKCI